MITPKTEELSPEELVAWASPSPRYTSYPPIPAWEPGGARTLIEEALGGLRLPCQVYVHVPFCESQCWYCGCNMVVARRQSAGDRYLDRLESYMNALPLNQRIPVTRIHLGGGTPTWLSTAQLGRLTRLLVERFAPIKGAELALEADPEATSPGLLDALLDLGWNRICFGVQSLDIRVLESVGRQQSASRAIPLIRHACSTGWGAVHVDLMYGLPRQSLYSLADAFLSVTALPVSQVSVFGYAHLPRVKPHQRQLERHPLPNALERARAVLMTQWFFRTVGFQPVGFDHFALHGHPLAEATKTGALHRNFMGYTTHPQVDLIGIGASAISDVNGVYWQSPRKLRQWSDAADAGDVTPERSYRLTPDDRLRRQIINGVLCNLTFDFSDLKGADSVSSARVESAARSLEPMAKAGLLRWEGDRLRVLEKGRPLLRVIASTFDAYFDAEAAARSVSSV